MGYLKIYINDIRHRTQYRFKCVHKNEGSGIFFHLSEEKKIKNEFPKDNLKLYMYKYLKFALYSLKLEVTHNALQLICLIDVKIKVNR